MMHFPLTVIRSNEMKTSPSGNLKNAHTHTQTQSQTHTHSHKLQCEFFLVQFHKSTMEVLNRIIYLSANLVAATGGLR